MKDKKAINIRKFDVDLWRLLKIEALKQDKPLWEVLEDAVRQYLEVWTEVRPGKRGGGDDE